MGFKSIYILVFLSISITTSAQDKVTHAEPLYMDLVRDLGARKGEKEVNVGTFLEDKIDFQTFGGFVEYEFAPVNRLGLEVEVPYEVHFKTNRDNSVSLPQSSISGVKLATQYTFYVSSKHSLSLAAGYANDFEFHLYRNTGKYHWAPENVMHPFFVAAKSWKRRFHTLLYTGPSFGFDITERKMNPEWLLNTNFHYMFPRSKSFIGLEMNQRIYDHGQYSLVLRPQARVALTQQMMLGFVVGVPVVSKGEGISIFCRLIYEFRSRKPKFPNVSSIGS